MIVPSSEREKRQLIVWQDDGIVRVMIWSHINPYMSRGQAIGNLGVDPVNLHGAYNWLTMGITWAKTIGVPYQNLHFTYLWKNNGFIHH